MKKPKKNEKVTVNITAMTLEGMGVARLESGFVVFVQDAAVGDVLEVLIMKVQKSFAYGKIVHIITPSPDRTEPLCPHYRLCGGCAFWHISYDSELRLKRDAVYNNIKKLGHANIETLDIIGAPKITEYRNKAQFPVKCARDGRLLLGFYRRRSHDVVNLESCKIQPPSIMAAAEAVREYIEVCGESVYDESAHKGAIRNVFVREARSSGDILVAIVANEVKLRDENRLAQILRKKVPGLCGVVLNINREKTNVIMGKEARVIWGKDEIRDRIGGIDFIIPHRSFYQVNPVQTETLYTKAVGMLDPKPYETVLDLYCGAGTISAFLAKRAKRVIGVEVVEDAVRIASRNAEINSLNNCEFYCGDAGEVAARLVKAGLRADALVVDPPRRGLDEGAVSAIVSLSPSRIMYVSCDSATLGRDIYKLSEYGYEVKNAVAVDMFPRTAHVETVCLLSKLSDAKHHVEVELNLDEMDLTSAESKATYEEIKAYVQKHAGLNVTKLYIAQTKRKCGIIERENYNLPKSEDSRQPQCPPEKEAAIKDALKHFGMI